MDYYLCHVRRLHRCGRAAGAKCRICPETAWASHEPKRPTCCIFFKSIESNWRFASFAVSAAEDHAGECWLRAPRAVCPLRPHRGNLTSVYKSAVQLAPGSFLCDVLLARQYQVQANSSHFLFAARRRLVPATPPADDGREGCLARKGSGHL